MAADQPLTMGLTRRRKFARVAVPAAAALALLGQGTTGAQILPVPPVVPCPGSPVAPGWFDTWAPDGSHGAVHCVQQGNHLVADLYNDAGERTHAVLDLWYGGSCDQARFVQPPAGQAWRVHLSSSSASYSRATGCGFAWAPIYETNAGEWVAWYTPVATAVVVFCSVGPAPWRACGAPDGGTVVVRPNGINLGPTATVRLVGYSSGPVAGHFATSIRVHPAPAPTVVYSSEA